MSVIFTVKTANNGDVDVEIEEETFGEYAEQDGNTELDRIEFDSLLKATASDLENEEVKTVVNSIFGDGDTEGTTELGDVSFFKFTGLLDGTTIDTTDPENTTVEGGNGSYVTGSETGIAIRQTNRHANYIDKNPDIHGDGSNVNPNEQLKAYLNDAGDSEDAVANVLTDMGFDGGVELANQLIRLADDSDQSVFDYLYSFDGALNYAGLQDGSSENDELSSGEIALALISDGDGYNIESFIEAYDAMNDDQGRAHLVRSVLFTEGYENRGEIFEQFADLDGEGAALLLFGVDSGTVAYGDIPDEIGDASIDDEIGDASIDDEVEDSNDDEVEDSNDDEVENSNDDEVENSNDDEVEDSNDDEVEDSNDDEVEDSNDGSSLYEETQTMQNDTVGEEPVDLEDTVRLDALGLTADEISFMDDEEDGIIEPYRVAAYLSLRDIFNVDAAQLDRDTYTLGDFNNIVGGGDGNATVEFTEDGRENGDTALRADLFFRMMGYHSEDGRYTDFAAFDGDTVEELYNFMAETGDHSFLDGNGETEDEEVEDEEGDDEEGEED